jgi:glycosyltransferase involved in cell wall biosynthesis
MPRERTESSIRTVAFVGNYLPRKCGIATFTSDLLQAVEARHPRSRCFAVPVNDTDGRYQYPDVVRFEIEEQDLESYRRAADFLNSSDVDIVSVQHEFGIFGGSAGSHLMALLRELKAPAVTTLHTVLLKPNADQHRVMRKLRRSISSHTVYPTYHLSPRIVRRSSLAWAERELLSPNKGIEHVLQALPDIVAEFPDIVYIVLGATHPHELRTRGEAYRRGLEAVVREHKLEN